MKRAVSLAALALGACTHGLDGTVVDANTGRPVANATVDIFNNRWGFRDGSLVWDKTYRTRARTNGAGKFHLDIDGGVNLTVIAEGYAKVVTSACASPMLVRVGGPYPDYMSANQLWLGIGPGRKRFGWSFSGHGSRVPEADADLQLVGPPLSLERRSVDLYAPRGMVVVNGTGNPPRPPPGASYSTRLKLDSDACGWLFVRTREGSTVAVQPSAARVEDPDGGRYALMIYRKTVDG